jgi:mono/diheme cytochrome c family protein
MSEVLSAAAAALGVPEALVQRAAAARAAETGMTVDEVLAVWAGGGDVPAPSPAPPPVAPEPAETTEEAPAPAAGVTDTAPVTPAAPPAPTTARVPPALTEVNSRQAARLPEVITVPTAGIRERTSSSIPRWLTTLLLATPLVALFALGGSATGQCGEGTELATDVVTGDIVNCDGSEFTGRPTGGGGSDFLALGESIYNGSAVTGVNCSGCHGAGGQGGGSFPALTGVLTTFGACADQIEWVSLGSAGFLAAGRDTYGDTGKPVTQGMPGFASTLTPEQLAAVVSFERVRFGGGEEAEVGADCGITAPEGEGPTGTTTPGGEPTGTTTPGGEPTGTTAPEARIGRNG